MQWITRLITTLLLAVSLAATAAETVSQGSINLNTATAEQLSTLSGVGKAKAEAIVHYRDTHGKFTNLDELKQVKGIGSAILEKNRAVLTLE